MEKLNKYSYLLSIVLVCSTLFVFVPGTADKFGIAKVGVLTILMILCSLVTLIMSLANFRQKLVISRATVAAILVIILILLLSIVSFTRSSNSINSFWGDATSIANAFWPYILSLCAAGLVMLASSGEKYMVKIALGLFLATVSIKSLIYTVLYLFTSSQVSGLISLLDYRTHIALAFAAVIAAVALANRRSFSLSLASFITGIINLSFLVLATPQLSAVALIIAVLFCLVIVRSSDKAKLALLSMCILAILAKFWLSSGAGNSLLPKAVDPLAAAVSSINSISESNASLIWGKGLGNFPHEFNKVRPVSVNSTADWQEVYTIPTSEFSRVIIEQGAGVTLAILGLIGYLGFLAYRQHSSELHDLQESIKSDVISESFSLAARFGLSGFVIAFLFTPWDITVWLWFAVFAGLVAANERENWYLPGWTGLLAAIAPVLLIAAIVLVRIVPLDPLSQLYTYLRAEQEFQKGLDEIQSNNARTAYEHITEARKFVPDKAKYRERFALLSLAIGESVLTATNGAESNVEQLFSQAITEIKIATEQLAPNSIPYWISRINIYSSLEDKYANSLIQAINSYDRLIALAPNQPLFRLQQGLKLHDNQEDIRATQRFSEAIALKPDYYQAYLARAQSYKAQGKLEEAKQDLVLISQKVAISDPVYQQAAEELKKLFGE